MPSQSCQRELVRVLDPQPPLLRAVDEEQPAERPERLAAERRLRLLVEQDHPPAGVGQLGGGDQAGEPRADDDDVRVHRTALYRIGRGRLGAMENQMTAEGLEALRAEIAELEGPARRAIAEEIKTARGFGDLKENAEYHEAKNAQARLETKILQLRQRLGDARVVEAAQGDVIGFGSTVELEDEATGKRMTYTLVAGHEASASEGKLSAESPMASALDGKRTGDVAVVPAPRGERRLKVIAV